MLRPTFIVATLMVCAVGLSACLSEINRPIKPGDPWRARAEETSRPMGVD